MADIEIIEVKDPAARREIERLRAELAQQQATTEYVALMAGVDIPEDEGNGMEGGAEDADR